MLQTDDTSDYIVLLLSDSNLPTGSFVASSGLESYLKHGFPTFLSTADAATVNFLRDSLGLYARSAIPFVSDAHRIVSEFVLQGRLERVVGAEGEGHNDILQALTELDELYQAMTLNHVARRASMSQGAALLTLYSKGFSRPSTLSAFSGLESQDQEAGRIGKLIDLFKLKIRKEQVFGHLPICWGILTAALGLNLERSQYLHIFLHARSLLSASVRLNDLGPYNAQQVLLHAVQPLVAAEVTRCKDLHTGLYIKQRDVFDETTQGPANTWPLGEILAGRHDLQHSRIFNS